MRLWSLHPQYLDRAGLLAVWREGLLAKAVLEGKTKGYTNHPQLNRFKASDDPLQAINAYLHTIVDEATVRGYNFDRTKLAQVSPMNPLIVSDGQVAYEREHLLRKLAVRDPARQQTLQASDAVMAHPSFVMEPGPIADWEKIS